MAKTKLNPVAKNFNKFNKPATHVDRKKESKIRGHKSDMTWIDEVKHKRIVREE
jgi:hypothetical protein